MKTRPENEMAKKEETALRWTPMRVFDELRQDMEELWRFPWVRPLPRAAGAWIPSADIFRQNGDLVVKADLPGLKREEIEVTVDNGDLVLCGERKHEEEVKEENLYRWERSHGKFFRRLALPYDVEPTQISAKFADGVLEVHIPMPAPEEVAAQKIPVQ
jgi:HSP20 family protein